jgi:hypothetical protein
VKPSGAAARLTIGRLSWRGVAMQFVESSIVGVRSSVLTLERRASPMRFVLFPMVHVAERSFYDEVTARVRGCALIVAEGIGEGGAPVQRRMARIRLDDLVDQTVALDLDSLGIPVFWEYARRPPRTSAERLTETATDSLGAIALRVLGRYGDPIRLPNLDESDDHDDRWMEGRFNRWMRDRVVDRRDEALTRRLASVHRECHDQPITVAVVYGAGHMPAVVECLRGEFGYFVQDAEWLIVRNAPV